MVVHLLTEDEIPARSDSNQAMNIFGELSFRARAQDLRAGFDGGEGSRDPQPVSPLP